jgi:hypothetical protein
MLADIFFSFSFLLILLFLFGSGIYDILESPRWAYQNVWAARGCRKMVSLSGMVGWKFS